ncbi:MAG: hypothetical protein HQM04_08765 [Magnetococcales bacterium]|nr:hypothetical protein [Magnetococcales bacterium]MBF0115124.1 hypothetical protein [Magnetococcales bacterium]
MEDKAGMDVQISLLLGVNSGQYEVQNRGCAEEKATIITIQWWLDGQRGA